jgi:hypothetical protein
MGIKNTPQKFFYIEYLNYIWDIKTEDMKKLALILSLFLAIGANAQTDIKTQFVKYLKESSKMSLYEMDPNSGFSPNDSMTVCKINWYNQGVSLQHKTPENLNRLEKSLRRKGVPYDKEVYVFEGDFVYGTSVPISGSGEGVNTNSIDKGSDPFAAFTYYKEYGNTVLIVVQARDPKNGLF